MAMTEYADRTGLLALLVLGVGLFSGCGENRASYTHPEPREVPRPAELARAEQDLAAGRAEEAQESLEDWIEKNPDSSNLADAYYLAGKSLRAQGRVEEAKKYFEQAEKLAVRRTVKAQAMLARADCNYDLGKYHKASREYHWLEQTHRDVTGIRHDELLFKLGMCCKKVDRQEAADYWFKKVVELYATGPYAAEARRQHSKLGPSESGEPTYYTLEVGSYSSEERANQEAEAFREKGYSDVQVKETTILSETYYAVHIGKFFNKTDAKRAMEDAALVGFDTSIRPSYIPVFK